MNDSSGPRKPAPKPSWERLNQSQWQRSILEGAQGRHWCRQNWGKEGGGREHGRQGCTQHHASTDLSLTLPEDWRVTLWKSRVSLDWNHPAQLGGFNPQNRGAFNHCTPWNLNFPTPWHQPSPISHPHTHLLKSCSQNSVGKKQEEYSWGIWSAQEEKPKDTNTGDSPTNGTPRISWCKSKGPAHVRQRGKGAERNKLYKPPIT